MANGTDFIGIIVMLGIVGLTIAQGLIKSKLGIGLESTLINSVFKGKTKTQKLAYGFKIAELSLRFKEYVSLDFIDGGGILAQELDEWLKEKIQLHRKTHPINNIH